MIKLISLSGKGKDFVGSSSDVLFIVTITDIVHKYNYTTSPRGLLLREIRNETKQTFIEPRLLEQITKVKLVMHVGNLADSLK